MCKATMVFFPKWEESKSQFIQPPRTPLLDPRPWDCTFKLSIFSGMTLNLGGGMGLVEVLLIWDFLVPSFSSIPYSFKWRQDVTKWPWEGIASGRLKGCPNFSEASAFNFVQDCILVVLDLFSKYLKLQWPWKMWFTTDPYTYNINAPVVMWSQFA